MYTKKAKRSQKPQKTVKKSSHLKNVLFLFFRWGEWTRLFRKENSSQSKTRPKNVNKRVGKKLLISSVSTFLHLTQKYIYLSECLKIKESLR